MGKYAAIIIVFIVFLLFAGSTLTALRSLPNKEGGGTASADDASTSTSAWNENDNLASKFTALFADSRSQKDLKLKGEKEDQIAFLFLGVGGEEHVSGKYLSDTIILIVFNPSNKKSAIVSIPRDLLVRVPNQKYFTRINALYALPKTNPSAFPERLVGISTEFPGPLGIELVKEKITEITGISVNYYAVFDLRGVEKIVDILGGINVRRFEDIVDEKFPDKKYGYETYEINKGWRYLDGQEAVKYIRTRHTPGGDFDRMQRQQEVAFAIAEKIKGLQSLSELPKLFSIYTALQDHFSTDMTFAEIMRLMEISQEAHEEALFDRITTGPDGLLLNDSVLWGGQKASILRPRAGTENYEEIKKMVKELINKIKP